MSALDLKGVCKTFGGLRAVHDVSFSVPEKCIFGLIGPNGAGKTTVFNLITGVYKPDLGGAISFRGTDVVALRPSQIARVGVARTFQNIRLFGQLTVLENVLVACENKRKAHLGSALLRTPLFYRDEEEMTAHALDLLDIFDLGNMADEISTSLSYGNQRRLEIARAMMLSPKLLLLDEPAAGMNPVETHEITELIGKLREELGYTIFVIEHDMHLVEGISDRVIALDHGIKIAEGSFDEVATDPSVVEAYLGLRAEKEAS